MTWIPPSDWTRITTKARLRGYETDRCLGKPSSDSMPAVS